MLSNASKLSVPVIVFVFVLLISSVPAQGALQLVGPVDPADGFPRWYRDTTGLTLEKCLDNNGFCLFVPAIDLPNPAAPVSFPGNYPGEIFWWTAEAPLGGAGQPVDALLVLAMEGAFVSGDTAVPGEQMTFGRVRIRADLPAPGRYTFTYPFGAKTYDVASVDVGREVFATEDIGCFPVPQAGVFCDFNLALVSNIGPFLVWDNVGADPPELRDPVTGRRY
ncbi:MAG: hypothetical protein HYX92_02510, partial [Chloroflexi bacterium]|nr:hypothetical protein [Chloroflexota bacterium]